MTEAEEARLKAEAYIAYQPRTSAEVRRRLTWGGYSEEVVEAVVADLERAELLDDARFSVEWVESRSRRKGLGSRRLAAELRQKGVGKEETEQALAELDPEQELNSALALAQKRMKPEEAADRDARRRLSAFLQRRGYGWDVIERVLARISTDPD